MEFHEKSHTISVRNSTIPEKKGQVQPIEKTVFLKCLQNNNYENLNVSKETILDMDFQKRNGFDPSVINALIYPIRSFNGSIIGNYRFLDQPWLSERNSFVNFSGMLQAVNKVSNGISYPEFSEKDAGICRILA